MTDQTNQSGPKQRRPWSEPQLSEFGKIKDLTAGGTITAKKEKDGMFDMMNDTWKPGTMP